MFKKGLRGLEVGYRAVKHFCLPTSPVNTLGIGSQLSKYWNIYWILRYDGICNDALEVLPYIHHAVLN